MIVTAAEILANVQRRPKLRPKPVAPTHGLSAYIIFGCRCRVCKDAKAAYARQLRATHAARPPAATVEHGTRNAYDNRCCRCQECRAANAEYFRTYRRRRAS